MSDTTMAKKLAALDLLCPLREAGERVYWEIEVDGETVRDNDAWRRWVAGQVDGQIDMETGEVTP
ncbi:hypothetical protein LCGC14_3152360 [marine sediment metagenome]|uniref:Uncharacterized protein n=1 Tax=marine sediment metagenome TaxID=412755 RepID=A0A0F8VTP0_9ZZZZ